MANHGAIGGGYEVDRIGVPTAEGFGGPTIALAAANEITRQLDGPLTALLIYMGEIKQHIHQFSQVGETRVYLREVAGNAIEQTERACAIVSQFAHAYQASGAARTGDPRQADAGGVMFAPVAGQKPLTKREREVLTLISAGHSNKQSARQMGISPRTFECHRAEVIRKLGARNTADLVRTALSHPGVVKPDGAAPKTG